MTPDNLLKLAIGLFGVLLGFILAQLATTIRAWHHRCKTQKLLIEELKDIEREATRLLYFYARRLQLHGAKGFQDCAAIGISNPIFVSFYKDVLLYLNQNQRISLQMIHSLVAAQNSILKQIEDVSADARKEHRANDVSDQFLRNVEELAELTKNGYSNCAIIKWHIDFHIKNPINPDLSPNTNDHENYLKYLESVVYEIDRTIETGKAIPKDKFEKIYNPKDFKFCP